MLARYALAAGGIIAGFILGFAPLSAAAQGVSTRRVKMDLLLQHRLGKAHAPDAMLDLFIRGQEGAVEAAVRAHGGWVKMSSGGIVSARLPVASVQALASLRAVERFEWSPDAGVLLSDSMRVKARVDQVHAGLAPLPQSYDGTGVIMGFIDDGLGIDHPDFQLPDGTTRVLHYWDQGLSGPGAPAPFFYGRAWSKAQIDAGQLESSYDGAVHGSTVASSGAGDGSANGRHKGVAPGADLVVVRYSTEGGGDFRARVADAVKYVFDRADEAGKPAVVNASLGTYSGSHDGKDAAALLIDSLIGARRGRFLVCAAGNSGAQFPYHLRHEPGSDTTFTWFTTNANGPQFNVFAPTPNLFFELWADIDQFEDARYAIGADRIAPSLQFRGRTAFHNLAENLGQVITEPLISLSGNQLGVVEFLALPRGEQVQLQVRIMDPDSAACLWRFMTTGSGRCDIWSLTTVTATSNVIGPALAAPLGLPFPSPSEYPAMARYVQPDNNSHIVDSWACSPRTLTAANYVNRNEYQPCAGSYINAPIVPYNISGGSSKGPTRDDRYKPDIAAPGDLTMGAAPMFIINDWSLTNADKMDEQCMHVRNGGTSMASPVVAGVAALYLQKCPNADWQQVREAIIGTAWGDDLTGPLPNLSFGYGRVHAFNALAGSNLPPITITASADELCSNDSVLVNAPPGFDAYLWSNGSTDNPTSYSGEGPLTVTAIAAPGCASSNALTFTVLPAPPTPVITADGNLLTSSPGPSYQWSLDGQPLDGATGQALWAPSVGEYTVEHVAPNGCAATSAPYQLITLGTAEGMRATGFAAWPSPTEGALTVQLPPGATGDARVLVHDAGGRLMLTKPVKGALQVDVDAAILAPGAYTLTLESAGARWATRFVRLP
ncbi:MAG: S8 family peptidase [Flavobacteriales bacterium]